MKTKRNKSTKWTNHICCGLNQRNGQFHLEKQAWCSLRCRAPLQGALLRETPLRGTPVHGAPLWGTPLRGASLHGTPLLWAPRQGDLLRGTTLPWAPRWGDLLRRTTMGNSTAGLPWGALFPEKNSFSFINLVGLALHYGSLSIVGCSWCESAQTPYDRRLLFS